MWKVIVNRRTKNFTVLIKLSDWDEDIQSLSPAKKSEFLFDQKNNTLLPICTSPIFHRPNLEYSSYVWAAAPPTLLPLLDAAQRKTIKVIGYPILSSKLSSRALLFISIRKKRELLIYRESWMWSQMPVDASSAL